MTRFKMKEIEIYKTKDGEATVEVHFEEETAWLTQKQMADLFGRDRVAITQHVGNIFKEKELEKKLVCKDFLHTTQHGAVKGKSQTKGVTHYNLDVIISVGYRIKSKRGTQFRQWATQRLKEYLVQGYAINQKRLDQLHKTIQLISAGGKTDDLRLKEAKGLLDIISNYTQSFVLLNQFDSNNLSEDDLNENVTYEIEYDEAKKAITELKTILVKKQEATDLFGKEKDRGFTSCLQSIVQTFDGKYLYPSIEEQAANLLYFIIKNHPFNDGNKRIGAFLFVWFLEKNKHRFKKNGEAKINDNGLTALALLVAQSDPADKALMIKLIINLINSR
jgi:death-on-curing family protein